MIQKSNSISLLPAALLFLGMIAISANLFAQNAPPGAVIHIAFSSDAHFGLTRDNFRGDTDVTAQKVNAAMIAQMNTLPACVLPADKGVEAGKQVKAVDYMIQTGDITNRMEEPIQTAAASWAQFQDVYMRQLKLTGHDDKPAKLYMVPGNHDISNAVGFAKGMKPATDATTMVNIYNLMLQPKTPLTVQGYDYKKYKVNYSKNIKGIHFMFITLWPDSAERIWMQKDLDTVASKTPVVIFTHDQPTCEAKHFTNPIAPFNMTVQNKFENLTTEHYKEGASTDAKGGSTDIEQRGWVKFLKAHPNIKAYFHGNSNYNEFYDYKGPDNDVNLHTFRVDSPMKGKYSSKDEKLLSFQLISLDPQSQQMTVRECLWNNEPSNKSQKLIFGTSSTVSLRVN